MKRIFLLNTLLINICYFSALTNISYSKEKVAIKKLLVDLNLIISLEKNLKFVCMIIIILKEWITLKLDIII